MSNSAKVSSSLPSGWANPLLGEVAQINPALDRCIIDNDLPVNFVPMRAVEPDGGGLLRPEVRSFGEVKKGYTPFLSGDVIMAKITPCLENGKTAVVPQFEERVCFGSTEFHVIRPERGVSAKWIANLLLRHDVRNAAQRQMSGGVGQMRVPSTFLETIRIPIPPAAEQQLIGYKLDELFSDLDAAVETLERTRKKLNLFRTSILKAAVEGELTTEWRAQHPNAEPASELLKRILVERRHRWEEQQLRKFKEKGQEPPVNWKAKYKEPLEPNTANLPILPNGWRWVSTEQVCEFITKGTTPFGDDAPRQNGEIPYIKVQHLSGTGKFHFDDSPSFVSKAIHHSFLSRSRVFPGDVLMNIVGPPLGQVSVVPSTFPEWNVNQAIAIFRPISGLLNKLAAAWLSSRPILAQALKRTKTTAGQVNLTLEVCRQIALPLPPFEEQAVILETLEDQLSVIDHLENDVEVKCKSAHSLRQSILRHAFEGKLVRQDPNDEPASELLKRIAADREERVRESAVTKAANTKAKKSRKRDERGTTVSSRRIA